MANNQNLLAEIIADTRALLQQAAKGPRRTVTLSPEVVAMLEALESRPAVPGPAPEPAAVPAPEPAAVPAAPPAPAITSEPLEELAAEVAGCVKCGLCETRTQTVFGVGNPDAQLVFVGEAPGAEEDRQGLPFVGRAGQLLTDIIVKGMHLKRDDVYICNVLKCRPPENRDPSPEEVYYCEPYLVRQLEIIQPKVICALGKYAAQTLLKSTASVSRMRGQWWRYHGIPLRVTFHPAYLLRNERDKALCWEDIKEILKVLQGKVTP